MVINLIVVDTLIGGRLPYLRCLHTIPLLLWHLINNAIHSIWIWMMNEWMRRRRWIHWLNPLSRRDRAGRITPQMRICRLLHLIPAVRHIRVYLL